MSAPGSVSSSGPSSDAAETLSALRQQIDTLDQQLVLLLNQRATLSMNIGRTKRRLAATSTTTTQMDIYAKPAANTVFVPAREMDIYEKASATPCMSNATQLRHGHVTTDQDSSY